ncbi:ATP-binding protein [Catalinimonas alkaloidigena]|uniref:PAS domain-containing sensor histidine kinase n=1 Tax=Catalinimonas alkaloidigena TaxID=1075417 RepID=UPI0015A19F87|nr:ATP-binding protein [Catalinimonas alkaloidigena]
MDRSPSWYEALVGHLPDVLVVCDRALQIRFVTPSVQVQLGYTPAELHGTSIRKLFLEEGWARFLEQWEGLAVHPERTLDLMLVLQPKTGEWVQADVRVRHLFDDPQVAGGLLTIRPMPEIEAGVVQLQDYIKQLKSAVKEQTQALEAKNQELHDALEHLKNTQLKLVESDKMASLGELTAGIAHEINNPINFVSSNITPLQTDLAEIQELLKQYETLHKETNVEARLNQIAQLRKALEPEFLFEEMEALIKGIREGADRTRSIVNGLRTFSRLDESDFKPADLHQGLESTLMLLSNRIKNRIEVHRDYGVLPLVECLPGKLNQVFMNIINNSLQAIEGKGNLWLHTQQKGNAVEIRIRDDGPGMSEDVKRRIFEPFFTTKDVGQGTGLGLSISFGVMERHQGRIEVESTPGKGTEFIITLPVQQEATQ